MEGGRTCQTCEMPNAAAKRASAGVAAPMTCLLAVRRVRADDGGVARRYLRRERVHRRPELAAHRSTGRARASRSARNDERTGGLPNRPRVRGALRERAESARASARPTRESFFPRRAASLAAVSRAMPRPRRRSRVFWLFRGLRQLGRRDSNRGVVFALSRAPPPPRRHAAASARVRAAPAARAGAKTRVRVLVRLAPSSLLRARSARRRVVESHLTNASLDLAPRRRRAH
jgi:hypothetical protein